MYGWRVWAVELTGSRVWRWCIGSVCLLVVCFKRPRKRGPTTLAKGASRTRLIVACRAVCGGLWRAMVMVVGGSARPGFFVELVSDRWPQLQAAIGLSWWWRGCPVCLHMALRHGFFARPGAGDQSRRDGDAIDVVPP